MSQLRETIKTMVRETLVPAIVHEAKGKKVYRHSNYVAAWKDLPKGSASAGKPSEEASKHDFVRWFLSQYLLPKNSTLRLTPEYHEKAKALLVPLTDQPDQFIEAMNKERELLFGKSNTDNEGSNFRVSLEDSTDPVAKLLEMYLEFKSMRGHLKKQTAFDHVKIDSGVEKESGNTRKYDIVAGTQSKVDISEMLSLDSTETTTEMSVVNRNRSALKHLANEEVSELLEFLRDPDVDAPNKRVMLENLARISGLVQRGLHDYSAMFVETMAKAYGSVNDPNNDVEVDEAVINGRDSFVALLEEKGALSKTVNKNSVNPYELNVFIAALNEVVEGDKTVSDVLVQSAGKLDEVVLDELVAVVTEVFRREMDKQTNFNSAGDYTDAQPELKSFRQNVFMTLEKRGRKPKAASST
jgi:hypothetical protein